MYTQSTSCSEALKDPKNAELMVLFSNPRQELSATCQVGAQQRACESVFGVKAVST